MKKSLSSIALFLSVATAAQPAWANGKDIPPKSAPQAAVAPSLQAPGKYLPAPQAPVKAHPAGQM
jgi:hypothetical protein